MILDIKSPLLVFVGAWNPAIFSPPWMAHHLFDVPQDQSVLAGQVFDASRNEVITFIQNVGIVVQQDRLRMFALTFDADTLSRLEQVATRVFEKLPHTPFGAYGLNFLYKVPDPEERLFDLLKTRDGIDRNYVVTRQNLTSTLRIEDDVEHVLNLSRRPAENEIVFDFNYHSATSPTAGTGLNRLRGIVRRFHEHSTELLARVYDLRQDSVAGFEIPDIGEGKDAQN